MKYVRCIYRGISDESSNLTVGKIYKVVNHNSDTKPHNNPTYTGSIWNQLLLLTTKIN